MAQIGDKAEHDDSVPIHPSIAVATLRTKALVALGSLAISFLLALLTVIATEWLARGQLDGVADFVLSTQRPGLALVGLVFVLLLATDAVLGRAHQSALIVVPIALLPAFLSGQKQQFLSDPLYPSDMLFGRQIMELLPVMVSARPVQAFVIAGSFVFLMALLTYLWLVTRRHFRPLTAPAKLLRLLVALPLIVGFVPLMDYARYSPVRDRLNIIPMMWDQQENYRHNGFLFAFGFNIPMVNVAAPVGYDAETIADIPSRMIGPAYQSSSRPDVIMVMSESLWDPTRLPETAMTPDPMAFMRAHRSGEIFSPEFGGMTANVEFEALTGFSNAFLPYGSIPYQQYIRQPLPSLATFFRSRGYSTRAFHPFQSWFWNRSNVYEALGFDSFASEENLPPMTKRGMFASDEDLTREIIKTADETEEPFFFFAVTLQGHGPYERQRYARNTISIEAPALSASSLDSLATYAQGVREADESLKQLMQWASRRHRETIIVLFGDHLPPLGPAYVESGFMPAQVATRKATVAQMRREHETPLVIWSSKSGVKKDVGSISPSLLPYHVVSMTGYRHPFYTGVLFRLQDGIKVVDRYQLIDAEGRGHPDWSASGRALPQVLEDYRMLQYDVMFGDGHGRARFFPEEELLIEPEDRQLDVPST